MTVSELKDYKQDFLRSYKQPKVITTSRQHPVSTGVNTSDRHALGGISWIQYYRAFTDPTIRVFKCACCGKSISDDPDVVDMDEVVYEAQGGHIMFSGKDADPDVLLDYYIVPMCEDCNKPDKKDVTILPSTTAVQEIAALVTKG